MCHEMQTCRGCSETEGLDMNEKQHSKFIALQEKKLFKVKLLIEKWFAHRRQYPRHAPRGHPYKSGFTDLVQKLFLQFRDTPTLDPADYADRLFKIFIEEISEKDNFESYLAAYIELVGVRGLLQLEKRDDYKAMVADLQRKMFERHEG